MSCQNRNLKSRLRSRFPIARTILLIIFVLGLALYVPRPANATVGPLSCTASVDFDVFGTPENVTIVAGGTGTSIISVLPLNGFTGTVTLAAVNPSTGLTSSLSQTSLSFGIAEKNSTLTITVAGSTLPGDYSVDVNATTSGTLFHEITIFVNVPSPELGITSNPTSLSLGLSSSATSTVDLIDLNGLTDVSANVSAIIPFAMGTPPNASILAFVPFSSGSGSATLTVATGASATPGLYSVIVTAIGNPSGDSNSTDVTVDVQGPGFTLTPSSGLIYSTLTIPAGQSATSTINVMSIYGFSGAVSLSYTVFPTPGPAATFSPASVPLTSGSTSPTAMTVRVSGTTSPGTYSLVPTGTSGSTSNETYYSIVVPGPGFSLSGSPGSLSIARGASAVHSTINVNGLGGFSGLVELSIFCSPDGLDASISVANVTLSSGGAPSATLTVSTYSFTSTGTYDISVDGAANSSSASNSTRVAVAVTAPGSGGPGPGSSSSKIFGLDPTVFYSIIGVVAAIIVMGAVFAVMKMKKQSAGASSRVMVPPAPPPPSAPAALASA
jgi:uncharacterized membrane protein